MDKGTKPSGAEVEEGATPAHPPSTSDDTLKPSRYHEDDTKSSELEQAAPEKTGTMTKKRVKQAKRQNMKPFETAVVDQPERLTGRGRREGGQQEQTII